MRQLLGRAVNASAASAADVIGQRPSHQIYKLNYNSEINNSEICSERRVRLGRAVSAAAAPRRQSLDSGRRSEN